MRCHELVKYINEPINCQKQQKSWDENRLLKMSSIAKYSISQYENQTDENKITFHYYGDEF